MIDNQITYVITTKNSEIGQISVAYMHNNEVLGEYAIDVPVVDGAYLTGDALHAEIMHRAPYWLISRKQEIQSASGFDQIEIQPLPAAQVDEAAVATAIMWEQFEFEKRVAAALVKFGVLADDPTKIKATLL